MTSCKDLITKHGCTDPKTLPQQMASMIGEARLMHVLTRKEGHVVVTNVTKAETINEYYPTSQEHSVLAIPPTTPNPKINQKNVRQLGHQVHHLLPFNNKLSIKCGCMSCLTYYLNVSNLTQLVH
ncbi:hypothetical protein Hdeb2414_s0005g00163321 [Helianthus debilis subsp. tardiflorus]